MKEILELLSHIRVSDIAIALGSALLAYLGTRHKGTSDYAQATIEKWDDLYSLLQRQRDDAISEVAETKKQLLLLQKQVNDLAEYVKLVEDLLEEATEESLDNYIKSLGPEKAKRLKALRKK